MAGLLLSPPLTQFYVKQGTSCLSRSPCTQLALTHPSTAGHSLGAPHRCPGHSLCRPNVRSQLQIC